MKPLHIALAGLGTVGCGTVSFLQKNADLIRQRAGREIVIVAVSARDRAKTRDIDLSGIAWVEDARLLADRSDIDVVCELVGGVGGLAEEVCEKTLLSGKSLVTANKALLAVKGGYLAGLAHKHGGALMFEGAVAGGIPAIKVVRESLAGNRFACVQGILNGTCNYILTRMDADGMDFAPVLAEAQKLGYAEADPSADVDGADAAHKLAMLSALAFGVVPDVTRVATEGLRRVTEADILFARQLGYKIKLLGVARQTANGLEQRVSPCLVPFSSPLASVEGVLNAVQIEGDAVGPLTLIGRGAGAGATASSVIGDLVDLARGVRPEPWGQAVEGLVNARALDPQDSQSRFYVRLQVADTVGVLADIAAIVRDEAISIDSILQHGRKIGGSVPVIIVTHQTNKAAINNAVAKLESLPSVDEAPLCLRIEG